MVDRQALTSSLEKVLSEPVFQAAITKALAESLAATFCDIQQDQADLADHMRQAKPPEAFGPELKVMGHAVVHGTGNSQWDRKRVELLDFCKVSGKYLVRTIYPQAAYGSRQITWVDRQSLETAEAVGYFDDVEGEWVEEKSPFDGRLNSDKIPKGYRKLGDSSGEPRQLGDLRWSVSEKRYIEIGVDEIGYANRDNWAACRKVETPAKQSSTTEPPDGYRWLEVGEVIRKGDLPYKDGLVYATEPIMLGMALQEHWKPMIRRNKFEVGEKVVEFINNRIGVVKDIEAIGKGIGSGKAFLYYVEMQDIKGMILFSLY